MEDENQRGNCSWAALERDREEEEQEEMASCSTELTRTNSGSLSLTANNVLEDFSRLGDNAFPQGPYVGWTDEKHHAYIRSLEASFINQLHRSTGLYGLPLKRKPHSCTQQPAHCCNSSHQSMVVRNGHWKKESVQKAAHLLESTADSTRDFEKEQAQSSGGFVIEGNSTVSLARISKKNPLYGPSHEDLSDDTTEVSDQNFVDEGLSKSSSLAVAKRLKTVEVDSSINDGIC